MSQAPRAHGASVWQLSGNSMPRRKRTEINSRICSSHHTEVRRVPRANTGQVHPESGGQDLARQVPPVLWLPRPADGQVLREERTALLQGRFLQVSIWSEFCWLQLWTNGWVVPFSRECFMAKVESGYVVSI